LSRRWPRDHTRKQKKKHKNTYALDHPCTPCGQNTGHCLPDSPDCFQITVQQAEAFAKHLLLERTHSFDGSAASVQVSSAQKATVRTDCFRW
jgi:hypothetical protein